MKKYKVQITLFDMILCEKFFKNKINANKFIKKHKCKFFDTCEYKTVTQ